MAELRLTVGQQSVALQLDDSLAATRLASFVEATGGPVGETVRVRMRWVLLQLASTLNERYLRAERQARVEAAVSAFETEQKTAQWAETGG